MKLRPHTHKAYTIAILSLLYLTGVISYNWFTRAPDCMSYHGKLEGHKREVSALAFSPDGKTLASGDVSLGMDEGVVIIWDVKTSALKWKITGQKRMIAELTFSPDGKAIAVGSDNLTLWNLKSRKVIRRWPDFLVSSVSFSPDGQSLAGACHVDNIIKVKIWDIKSGKLQRSFKSRDDGQALLAFSPNGKLLACAFADSIKVWDIKTGKLKYSFTNEEVLAQISFGSASNVLYLVASNTTLKSLNIDTKKAQSIPTPKLNYISNAAFSMKGNYVTATWHTGSFGSVSGAIQLWNTQNGKLLCTLTRNVDPMSSLAISNDGKFIAAGGAEGYNGIQIWSVK